MFESRLAALALLTAAGAAQAQTVDLIRHSGFDACWSDALTEAQFLSLLGASIEGQTVCVPQQNAGGPNYTFDYCNTAQCAGNAIGCPVPLHSGAFGGDFTRDSGAFSALGSVDVTVPAQLNLAPIGSITCSPVTISFTPTYAATFLETPDGNDGDYMAYLTNVNVTAPFSVIGDTCGGLDLYTTVVGPVLQTYVLDLATRALRQTDTKESVCPLTP